MRNPKKSVQVDVWADFICPQCWVAKRNFHTALEQFERRDLIDVNLRAYRVAPSQEPILYQDAIHQGLENPGLAISMLKRISELGISVGLHFDFNTMLYGDTDQAHALLKSAPGRMRRELHERLCLANTTSGRSIFTREGLLSVAQECGLPRSFADDSWSNPELLLGIRQDEAATKHIAPNAALFSFDGKFFIAGAQSVAIFRTALSQMLNSTIPYNTN